MWAGVPSTFVRISGCNLRCRWCDTKYASFEPEGPVFEVQEILNEVGKAGIEHVVVTGGEPMLFEAVIPLCEGLREMGKTITIESAGTVFRELPCDLMSLSPKLSNSTPSDFEAGTGWRERHEKTRLDRSCLSLLVEKYPYQLKFVVDPENSPGDLPEIDALLVELPPVPKDRIFLMAEGADSETLLRREKLLAPICLERGWRLSPRLQIRWFGNVRGT